MKKLLNSSALGGAPVYKSDLRDIFQDEMWDCIEAMFSPFDSDTEGVIVTGCVISGSGPYDISDGIVYLSGEFRRFAAVTGVTLPKYIVLSTSFYDNRVYANGVSNDFAITSNCELAASGTGQYIAITSPTDPNDRRLIRADGKLMVGLDTGWTTITLTNGWTAGTDVPKWRRIGNQVFLRGSVVGTGASNVLMCTGQLPSAGYVVGLTGHRLNVATVEVRDIAINTSGGITSSDYANSTVLYLDGKSYWIGS
jgi:hypothetical protein